LISHRRPEKIKGELANLNYLLRTGAANTVSEISAKKGTNVDKLLEKFCSRPKCSI
jgi:hypothetical protein